MGAKRGRPRHPDALTPAEWAMTNAVRHGMSGAAPHMIFRHPDGTEEWMAFFPDPDGHLLAIMSQVNA